MEAQVLSKTYEPGAVEDKWYEYWMERGFSRADTDSTKAPYSIVIPPPNITGSLHMGHALNNTLQDIVIRFQRMRGFNVLWMPGTDHAGIATQNVVERKLAEQGLDRHGLGREKFIERVWQWKEQYGGVITNQLKKLGASCDWSRERFTMDEGLSEAVREVFVRLYHEDLIYKGNYIINWCPRCRTALSDLEVEHDEESAKLYHLAYPLKSGGGLITVVTTRPETMLGDTAVAVNPKDDRYLVLIGEKVILPILYREIPIIGDEHVDMEFGSGALKVTPAHDLNDFEIALAHGLEMVKVIDEDGKMGKEAGPYQGMDRFECRKKIVGDFERDGTLLKMEDYRHNVGHCYRCKTIIEPTLSKQWFVRTKPLAEAAIQAVTDRRTKIIPSVWEKTYFEWMNNIRDWCISRQIWWGHRIPAWYCEKCDEIIVSKEEPHSCSRCGGREFRQETDVLDTWFSSALWPFSTLGWPKETEELRVFYPTSVLITGFDILFFWVARMMMMGLKFMGDVPFRHVYIHALVRDIQGRKMSKSRGNVIDPLLVMKEYGTDAFRFTLAAFAAQGRDICLSEERIEGYRHFANKIWNASRFSLTNLADFRGIAHEVDFHEMSLANRWILSRFNETVREVTEALEEYRFNEGAQAIYHFIWHEFCDWFLELIKPVLYGKDDQQERTVTQYVLMRVLDGALRLLHPFMPFITEEIWQRLPQEGKSIMIADFPRYDGGLRDEEAIGDMDLVMRTIGGIRNIRGEMDIAPNKRLDVLLLAEEDGIRERLEQCRKYVIHLARVDRLSFITSGQKPRDAARAVLRDMEILVPMGKGLDLEGEVRRLKKEIHKVEKDLEIADRKLSNDEFISKAPEEVVEKVKLKKEALLIREKKLRESLGKILEIQGSTLSKGGR
ncbi:MAG: valine--tRNA ligase [Thermodesulfobacteriota bacterium]